MNLGIIGYGKMGKSVEAIARSRSHDVSEIKEAQDSFLGEGDIYIDFTVPDAIETTVTDCILAKKPLVIGTTGWNAKKEWVDSMAKEAGIPMIYGGNFSLGVNLFWKILEEASKQFAPFASLYDPAIVEMHHTAKKDAPSGTALTMIDVVQKYFTEKQKVASDADIAHRAIESNELSVSSLRFGSVRGTHTFFLNSAVDTIEITHRATNGEGFALGAVLAAEKIHLLSPGLHHFPDIFEELFAR